MQAHFSLIGTGLAVLFLWTAATGQIVDSAFERWNDMWLGQWASGGFGAVDDPCDSVDPVNRCEFPGGSGMSYLDFMGLWIGAIIDEVGFQTPRVSVTFDGWFDVQEIFPADLPISESSRLDTTGCLDAPIYDPTAIADHQFQTIFADTLRDPFWVEDDPVDGPHRPLGLKITRSTYVMRDATCDHIHWIKYHVENIGSNFLKNVYIGHYVNTSVMGPVDSGSDDVCGYLGSHQLAYWTDNDGRASGDTAGTDFVNPHVAAMLYQPVEHDSFGGIIGTHAKQSLNWWVSNASSAFDFGPSWESYCDRDSLDMGWTSTHGTPVGDLEKYQLMRNKELDFCQAELSHPEQIPPQIVPQEAWWDTLVEPWCMSDSIPQYVHRGAEIRMLYSVGPVGIFEYVDAGGNYIYRLNPGESFDCWAAIIGGLNLHDPANPQIDPDNINIGLYNFMDLMTTANTARDPNCFSGWPQASEMPPEPMPKSFALEAVYPNPFNSAARISFALRSFGRVTVKAYDVLGREAAVITNGLYSSGTHSVEWNAEGLASGIYFVQASVNGRMFATQKAVLLK